MSSVKSVAYDVAVASWRINPVQGSHDAAVAASTRGIRLENGIDDLPTGFSNHEPPCAAPAKFPDENGFDAVRNLA